MSEDNFLEQILKDGTNLLLKTPIPWPEEFEYQDKINIIQSRIFVASAKDDYELCSKLQQVLSEIENDKKGKKDS